MAGTAGVPDESGEEGGPCAVVGARTTLDLNSAWQQKLRDRTVDVRAGATGHAERGWWPCKSVDSKHSN